MKFHYLFCIAFFFSGFATAESFQKELLAAAKYRTTLDVTYDGRYHSIDYPNGDVPGHIGVCTDVLIRSYRVLGIDFQRLIHEDMSVAFDQYPSKRIWGLSRTDKNIDHRRVPNIEVFLSRHGETLAITQHSKDYKPGDIVTWRLPGNLPHIGIVSDERDEETGNPLVIHNIGAGPVSEDMLFAYQITGHYRFEGIPIKNNQSDK